LFCAYEDREDDSQAADEGAGYEISVDLSGGSHRDRMVAPVAASARATCVLQWYWRSYG
jgi:hypothetical protein